MSQLLTMRAALLFAIAVATTGCTGIATRACGPEPLVMPPCISSPDVCRRYGPRIKAEIRDMIREQRARRDKWLACRRSAPLRELGVWVRAAVVVASSR